jgi:hypothetical protein
LIARNNNWIDRKKEQLATKKAESMSRQVPGHVHVAACNAVKKGKVRPQPFHNPTANPAPNPTTQVMSVESRSPIPL